MGLAGADWCGRSALLLCCAAASRCMRSPASQMAAQNTVASARTVWLSQCLQGSGSKGAAH